MAKPWFVQIMGTELGPLTPAEMADKVKRAQIEPDTLVRAGADGKWLPAIKVKGLLDLAPASPLPPAPPPRVVKSGKPGELESAPPAATATAVSTAIQPQANVPADDDDDAYHLAGDDHHAEAHAPHSDHYEFFEFVGFRQAITPALYDVLYEYVVKNGTNITQVTRRALAEFLGRKDLIEEKPPPNAEEKSEAAAEEQSTSA